MRLKGGFLFLTLLAACAGSSVSPTTPSQSNAEQFVPGSLALTEPIMPMATAPPPFIANGKNRRKPFRLASEQRELRVTVPRYIWMPDGSARKISGPGPDMIPARTKLLPDTSTSAPSESSATYPTPVVVSSSGDSGQGQIITTDAGGVEDDEAYQTAYESWAPGQSGDY